MEGNYNTLVTARFAKPMLQELEHSLSPVKYCGWGVDRRLLKEALLIEELKGVDIFISEYETISRNAIEASESLKLIACCRNEPLASIDLDAATERGIPVLSPPDRNAVSVA